MLELFSDPQAWIALLTLTSLEIVLGIDNIIFISILSGKLPESQQPRARFIGLALALFGRLALLFTLTWIMGLTAPMFEVFGHEISGRDLILIFGGLFLLYKSTHEIHDKLEGDEHEASIGKAVTFGSVIFQILLLDIVFSLDSVITAVGMVDELPIMVIAVVIAIIIMMISAKSVATFIEKHPTVKMLALAFLMLVGMALIAEGFEVHVPRGYVYFAMAFSVFVEMLNLRMRTRKRKKAAVELRPSRRKPNA